MMIVGAGMVSVGNTAKQRVAEVVVNQNRGKFGSGSTLAIINVDGAKLR